MTHIPADIKALAAELLRLMPKAAGEQLAYSSIEDGAIREFDLEGTQTAQYGQQYDGTSAAVTLVSPEPPRPSPPTVTGVVGGLVIAWDGTYLDDEGNVDITIVAPLDWARVDLVVGPDGMDPIATPPDGAFASARGGRVFVSTTPGLHDVALVTRTTAGRPSAPSPVVEGTAIAPGTGGGGSGNVVFREEDEPVAVAAGDLWIKTSTNQTHYWDGTDWIPLVIDENSLADGAVTGDKLALDALYAKDIVGAFIRSAESGARWEWLGGGWANTLFSYTGAVEEVTPGGLIATNDRKGMVALLGNNSGAGQAKIQLSNQAPSGGGLETYMDGYAGGIRWYATRVAGISAEGSGIDVHSAADAWEGNFWSVNGIYGQTAAGTGMEIRSPVGIALNALDPGITDGDSWITIEPYEIELKVPNASLSLGTSGYLVYTGTQVHFKTALTLMGDITSNVQRYASIARLNSQAGGDGLGYESRTYLASAAKATHATRLLKAGGEVARMELGEDGLLSTVGIISTPMRTLEFKWTVSTALAVASATPTSMATRGGAGTFVAPPSGRVTVGFGALVKGRAANIYCGVGVRVREGAAQDAGTIVYDYTTDNFAANYSVSFASVWNEIELSGLTAGSTYNVRQLVASADATAGAQVARGRVMVRPST